MCMYGKWRGLGLHRDGKSLQNSTGKTLSLKNNHTKYVQKMIKNHAIICKNAKKRHTKNQNLFLEKPVEKPKISIPVKN